MRLSMKEALGAGGNQPEGEDQNPGKEPIMKDVTSVTPATEKARYVVVGTGIHDRQADRIARFQNAGVAQIGADWLNGPDASPEDYEWVSAADMTSDEWIAAHPEVSAFAPVWAGAIDASDEHDGRVALSFDRDFGAVEIGMAASWSGGRVTTNDRNVYVYFRANEAAVSVESLRAYARQFAAAADALDRAGVSR